MSSTDQTTTKNDAKPQLSKAEMDSLISATGYSEEEIRKSCEETLEEKFPVDGMTEEQFQKMMFITTKTFNSNKVDVVKTLFKIVDRDNSGKISLYEYLLAIALLSKTDNPEIMTKCLFKLCDADRDGFLTQAEICDFFIIMTKIGEEKGDKKQDNVDNQLDEMKRIISKAFGAKTQISEKELHQIITENQEVKELAQTLQFLVVMGIGYGGPGTSYGTEVPSANETE